MSGDDELPDYADGLDALHECADQEFRDILRSFPIADERTLVDVACGDGYFSRLISDLFPELRILASDTCKAYRELAIERNVASGFSSKIEVIDLDATAMDFRRESIDVFFCGYSFQSISDHDAVLTEISAALKPNGLLILLETDGIHNLILPIASQLELKIRTAELEGNQRSGNEQGWAFGRECPRILARNGFKLASLQTFVIDRMAPFSEATKAWLTYEFNMIADAVAKAGSTELLGHLKDSFSDQTENSILNQTQSRVTAIHSCFIAKKMPILDH